LVAGVARDRAGAVAVVFALSLPLLLAGAGLGIETSLWYFMRLKAQSAADVAAYSAALEARGGSSDGVVEDVATQVASENGYSPTTGTIQVIQDAQSGGGSVEVIVTSTTDRYFTAVFNPTPVTATARAVANFSDASSACVLALDRTAGKAANFSGSADLKLTGCSVMSNSSAINALNVQGSAKLRTDCAIAVGGITATSGMTLTDCPSAITSAPPVADPFRNLAAPTPTGGCLSAPNNNGTMQPGRYCSGASLKGKVTLNPGVYYMEGDFSAQSTAELSGTGVTIYMSGASRVTFNGNAAVNLAAPTSGTYSGMLFFGDRNSTGSTNKFNGTAASKMTGAIYFASQNIEYMGNFAGENGCTQVVGRTVEWTGNTTVAVDCTGYGMKKIPALNAVRLSA
jgi:Flp pilus assembly protein TadG